MLEQFDTANLLAATEDRVELELLREKFDDLVAEVQKLKTGNNKYNCSNRDYQLMRRRCN